MDKLLLRPVEVANLLGFGRTRIYELISCGDIPHIRIGGSIRIPVESLKAWIGSKQGGDSD